jgi:transposase InsO family protein
MYKERTVAMNRLYRSLKEKSRGCRDRDVRIKLELFMLVLKHGNVSECCAKRGFSRKFYYKWWNRFKKSNYDLKSLNEKSRRPKTSPKKISKFIEDRIFWYRRRNYGARVIHAHLKREGMQVSLSTVCHVLRKRKHRPLNKKQRLNTHRRRYELLIPGQRLQLDVKYAPQLIEGKRAYVFVAIDECTRWRFAQAYFTLSPDSTVDFLNQLLKACPFPIHTIQTDHGFEFTRTLYFTGNHSIHPMDYWCEKKGIKHQLIPVGVKELNGKVERSHRIDEQYFYWQAPIHTLEAFQLALKKWIHYYNTQRLHGGIQYSTPWEKLLERRKTLEAPPLPALSPLQEELRINFINNMPRILSERCQSYHLEKKIA